MATYLLMRIYGPLASWGEVAVGEMRHSSVQPSRSALLGLLGAALGLERDDDDAQRALAAGYRFGIKLVATGSPLRDYHTVQVGEPGRKQVFRSRRQSLVEGKVSTLLSTREYRCDSVAVVAVEVAHDDAPYSLEQLAGALRTPHYTPYLGRKSCPLAVPLMPQCIEADDLRAALDGVPLPSLMALLTSRPDASWPSPMDQRAFALQAPRYFWEDGMTPGMEASFSTVRHDQPLSRRRWQFAPRREHVSLGGGEP
ncbi:type I-E CRISPR-associated protein Cas5/CasD [Achromobacter sp. GG226]|uniref:type I-E CRISPR-associated protein Cas5/CasD n=1 Tax=Verticiella alkaliphila TaxID=2779529 RepID=UPI001C0D0F25|nr:type I-E CRISPR-associated protein Cas5/CasD [Verticiella sp. GG226]MBU4612119.1 type I-E CRISPR-associated protein Cas5/CasD [Verticiella sp. GG226]